VPSRLNMLVYKYLYWCDKFWLRREIGSAVGTQNHRNIGESNGND